MRLPIREKPQFLIVLLYCSAITRKPAFTYIVIFVARRLSHIGKRTFNLVVIEQRRTIRNRKCGRQEVT